MKYLGLALIMLLLISSGSSLAAQPADQGQIVFSTDLDGDFDIYRLDVASGDLYQLTNDPAEDHNPAWSPDGQRIAFQSNRDGNYEIYVMQADGSQVQRLTNTPSVDRDPAWSPDGSQIAFSSNRDGDLDLYIMRADGGDAQPLTVNTTIQDAQPAWAADGSRLFYTRIHGDETTCAATIQADGSGARCVGPTDAQISMPLPAPDGRMLAVAQEVDGNRQVHLLDLATETVGAPLTSSEIGLPLAWYPDSLALLYAEKEGENRYLSVVGRDGNNPTRIGNLPHIGVRADWLAPVEMASGAGSQTVPVSVPPSGQTVEVQARCVDIGIDPPPITEADEVLIHWAWVTRDPAYLHPHLLHVTYDVRLDGVPLTFGDPGYDEVPVTDYTLYALDWYASVGQLAAGTHRIEYLATWDAPISTGRSEYGPGTENPEQRSVCLFEVSAVEVPAGQEPTADLPAGEITLAELPTAADGTAFFTPGELTVYDDDANGVPESYAYTFAPAEPVPGVALVQVAALMADSQEGAVVLVATNTTAQPQRFQYRLDIPKSFAAHIDALSFVAGDIKVIDPDPVVVFDVSTDPNSDATIVAQSYSVQADGQDLATVMHVFNAFEYERVARSCEETEGADRVRCFRTVMLSFPNHVTEADCDNLTAPDSFGETREDWVLACRAIVTHDPWECTRLDSQRDRQNCAIDVYTSLRNGCRYFTDEPEDACLLDAAVTSGLQRACAEIPADNALYRATCEAQITQNPSACTALADAASRQACCGAFAGTALYSQCAGEPASGGSAAVQAEGPGVLEGPVREGIYEVDSTSTGTLHDGATETDHFFVALKVCDGGDRLDYKAYENQGDIDSLCIRPEDTYYRHFWQVSPGVYERVSDTGVSTLTIDSPTSLHYYAPLVYAGGYTSTTEMWFTWTSDLP